MPLSSCKMPDTRSFSSIGIDVLHHADGPTGLRKQAGKGDHLG